MNSFLDPRPLRILTRSVTQAVRCSPFAEYQPSISLAIEAFTYRAVTRLQECCCLVGKQ